MSHSQISPAIHYWGTPVVLITTVNEDGSYNIAPISSAWWLGDSCMLGFGPGSHTVRNLLRTKQCVLNLPSDDMAGPINALARTTGSPIVSEMKQKLGYRFVKDKFAVTGLTPQGSELIATPRIKECPVQMEAGFVGEYGLLSKSLPADVPPWHAIEVRVLRTYVTDELRLKGCQNRIDPDKWKPMIMSFQHLYGLKDGKNAESNLAKIEEELYRMPPKLCMASR